MKKIIALVVCVLLVVMIFAACAEQAAETAPEEAAAEEPAAAEPAGSGNDAITVPDLSGQDLYVGFSTGSSGTSWRDIMINSFTEVAEAYKADGTIKDYKIVNNTTNGDANEQASIVRDFVDDPNINIIMINPNDNTALNEVIAQAQEAGKLVVVADATADAPKTLNVTLDHYNWYKKSAEFICENLGEGNAVEVFGLDGHPASVARSQALTDTLADYPDINMLQRSPGGWDQTQAKEVMAQILASGQEIDAVFTQDGMAYGCLSAFEDAGKLPKVMFGDAGTAFAKEWNKLREEGADFIACTRPNPPGICATGLRIAVALAQGKEFKDGVLDDNVYFYQVQSFYTDDNFDELYEVVKDQDDSFLIDEYMTQEDCDALFK